MPFVISIHEDISLANLLDIHNKKGVVLKTPHIGNIYPNNLAIAALGIPILCYDRTTGEKDLNFHPDKLIVNGKSEIIAEPDILTTHSTITHIPSGSTEKPAIGSKVADFHMSALKRALPKTRCITYTEYIQGTKNNILKILEAVTNLHPFLWMRTVDKNGKTAKSSAKNWSDITKLGIYGLTNMKSGWIIPNPVNILFHGIIDAMKVNVKDIYLLSGPDMYRYVNGYQEQLNEMYDHVRKTLDWNLPETVNCHIIPVISMRFVVKLDDKKALDELVNIYLKYISAEKNLNTVTKAGDKPDLVGKLIEEKNAIKEKIIECIKRNFETFKNTMFYNIDDANCFTQHDLLNSKGLYIHQWAIDSNLTDVSEAYNFLNGCYSVVKNQLQTKKFNQ